MFSDIFNKVKNVVGDMFNKGRNVVGDVLKTGSNLVSTYLPKAGEIINDVSPIIKQGSDLISGKGGNFMDLITNIGRVKNKYFQR